MAKEPKEPEGVDVETLARFWGCDVRTVQNEAKAGVAIRLKHGRYALVQSTQNYCRKLREQAAGRATTEGGINPAEESALLRREQRTLAELKRHHLEGRLLSLEEVKAAWRDVVQGTQQLFRSLPSRARFDMPHLTGADQKQLKRICDEMLTETAFGRPNIAGSPPLPAADEDGEDKAA